MLPVTLIPIRPCHLKQKVGEICQCNFHTVRSCSCELVTPANSDGGTRIVGDYTLPELRCPKSGLMGLLHRSKVAKVAPGHCSTRWAQLVLPGGHGCNTHCLVRCARSKLPRADHNGWVEGIVTNRVDTGGALSYIHSYAFCEPLI